MPPPYPCTPTGTFGPTWTAAPRVTVEGWLPFVFFTDRETGRGSLLYRRYDGDLGLIRAY